MKSAPSWFGLAFAVGLGGCATADGPSFQEAKATAVKPETAVVYVFRKYAEPTAWSTTIHIDDKEVATLGQGSFTWAYVTPGKRTFRGVWPGLSSQKDSLIELDVQAGKTYYVELTGISRMTGVSGTLIYYRMGSGLNERAPEAAESIMTQCCKFQKPGATQF